MMVLYLDRWARHSLESHYYPISTHLAEKEIKSKFLHFGSVFDEEYIDKNEDNVIDVSFFKRKDRNAKSIIQLLKPDLVLFSGPINQPIFQSFIHVCQKQQIPIGWIQYGNVIIKGSKDLNGMVKHSKFSEVINNISYSLVFLISSYIRTGRIFLMFRMLYNYFLAFLRFRSDYARIILDFILRPDFAIIFNSETRYKLRPLKIEREYICGNPFIEFDDSLDPYNFDPENRKALIIVQPFYETGIVRNLEWLVSQYIQIIESLLKFNFDVVVKLHPLSSNEFEEILATRDCLIVRKGALQKLIAESNIVIGVSSTVLLSSIFLRKTTILTSWFAPDHLKGVGFSNFDVFDICHNINDFEQFLRDSVDFTIDEIKREEFIEKFIGPASGIESIKRISQALQTEITLKSD